MIYNKKNSTMPKPIRKKILLSNFLGYDESKTKDNLPCDYTDHCYNFAFKNNKLIGKYGVQNLMLVNQNQVLPELGKLTGEVNLFLAKNADRQSNYTTFVVSHRGGLECLDFCKGEAWTHIDCESIMISAVRYLFGDRELLLMSDGVNGIKVMENKQVTSINNSLAILDMCVHYERIFAVVSGNRNSLWFSDDFDPFNWNVSISEGGYIEFDGSLGNVNVVKSFRDYLYVFCDYGIYRLSAMADQTQFSIKKLYCACGKIFAKSVADCGDRIVFVSSDGIYFFDGYDVARYNIDITKLIDSGFDKVSAAYCNHKYYVSIKNKQSNEYGFEQVDDTNNNMLIVCDMLSKNIDICKGVNLDELTNLLCPDLNCVVGLSIDSNNLICLNENGKYLDKQTVRVWRVNNIDFGNHLAQKIVRGVEYSTDYQYTLGIVADNKIVEFLLIPNEKYKNINLKANSFDFYIKCDLDKVEISSPRIVVDFLR